MTLSFMAVPAFAEERTVTNTDSKVVRIQDTENWYPDATEAFDTRDSFWNNEVNTAPEGYDASGNTVIIDSAEDLVWWAKQVNSGVPFANKTISITADIDLSAHYWTPICTGTVNYSDDGKYSIAGNDVLDGVTIDGNGNTITGLATQTGVRGPNQDSQPGDGSDCYYDAAFIGYSSCDITVQNLIFDGARVAITEPFELVVYDHGSSMVSVIVGAQNGGSLTLNNVTVNDAAVLAMQKASAFVSNLMGDSILTVNNCAITNSTFSAYFMVAPIAGYGSANQVNINGIKLENNTINVVELASSNYTYDEETGAEYWDGDLNASTTTVFYDTTAPLIPVAELNGYGYDSLSAAVAAADSGDTVKVLSNTDISGSKVVVSANKSLTLDLNGKEVKAVNNGNIFVSGKLTIRDTSDGAQGTIRATQEYSESYTGGIVVASGEDALLTMESGNIVASGFEDPKNNGQFGVMVQGGGDFTMTGGKIEAGWYAAAGNGNDKTTNSVINIQGGELISTADYALYLPQSGNTTISGGTIRGAAGGISIQRGTLTIDNDNALITSLGTGDTGDWGDGTGGQDPAALNIAAEYGNTSVTISAGKFIAEQKDLFIKAPTKYTVSLAITGGYYSNDPSEFLNTVDEKNYVAVESDLDGYSYMVVEANAEAAEVVPAAPEVTAPANLDGEDKAVADAVAEAMKGEDAPALVAGDGLDAAAATQANENKVTVAQGTEALTRANITTNEKTVTIVVQPYMDVEITAVDKTAGTITLDITPRYRTVATTADLNAPTPEDIKVSGDADVGNDANAVEIPGVGGELTITKEVTITIPLGNSNLFTGGDSVYVKHSKDGSLVGYHKATIGGSEGAYTLTFTNDKGFSTFEAAKDDRTAKVSFNGTDEVTYTPANVNDALPTAAAPSGQVFGGWQFDGISGTYTTLTDELLTALDTAYGNGTNGAVSATPYFYTPSHGGSSGSSGYAITVPSDIKNGDVTVSPSRATAGTVVTITVKPDAGYELDSLTVTDKNGETVALKDIGNNKYTFTMPSGAVKIAAEFVEETPVSTLPFDDVAATAWYYDAVEYVYESDLMNGTSSTIFAPNATLTRGMLATVLWRMEGSPVVNYALPFEDVSGDQWYTEAIRWAASVGVVNGTSATTYAPNANITREQLATMLYRYAAYKSGSVSTSASLSGFTDAGSVSDYAADAMEWAVAEEIIGGMTSTTLVPQGSATRAQTATMLMRYCENVL